MKLNEQQKSKLVQLIKKACTTYSHEYNRKLYYAILRIVEEQKERSLPEHKLYWTFCAWLSKNIPETILNMLGIKSMTSEMVHALFKAKFEVESTAFNSMDEQEFNSYFRACVDWTASYILRCDIKDLKDFINEGEI